MSGTDAFLTRLRAFAQGSVAAAAPRWSLGDAPDPALYREAADIGLLGTTVPATHGGQAHDFATLVAACQTLAAVDFGFAMSLVNTHNVGLRLCLSAGDALRDRYLPQILKGEISACTALTEPGAGTDFAAITTQAVETETGWRLNGGKRWIINGRHAGAAMVFAQCKSMGDASGIAGFFVDLSLPGARRFAIESGFSQSSMGTGGFELTDVEVGAECLLLPPGTAFKAILTEINAARTYVAAMCDAMLGAAIDEAAAYGAQRMSFGQTLDQHPSWRQPLGAAQADLAASTALTAQAVARITEGADAQLTAAQAKITAVETAQRHLPALLHAMGAAGLEPERCFTRHLAAAQIAGLTDGATSILRDRVARLTQARNVKDRR
ncbi:acyl-CoA dehydrogenase family protein [Aestuariivita boseongensis]|uniref:acyl-CoA dehydrogenase family protein n=1 Tax=Aestuariivita boseongensis TaxID=1470562 RepID=UPI00068229BC|nr:acyl-CoA dehydrogenase family protein [Aestuariivita boseongensis]